jgi:hypothetical protein
MPSRKDVSSKSCLMNSRAPEITPVSYPKSKPPVAVIAAALFTNFRLSAVPALALPADIPLPFPSGLEPR